MTVSDNEGHVSQLAASEGHLKVFGQLITVAVFLVDTVQHWRWWAERGEGEAKMKKEKERKLNQLP